MYRDAVSSTMPQGHKNPLFVHSALDDAGLSVYAFRIAGRIARRWSEKEGCRESVDNMAAGCGINRKTAYDAIRELTDRRIVVKTARPGRPSRYDFAPISEWSDLSHEAGHPYPARRAIPPDGLSRQTVQVPIPPDGTPPVPPDGTLRDTSKGSSKGIPLGVVRAPETGAEGQRPRPTGGPFDHPAVHAYADAAGITPPMSHAGLIAKALPNPTPDDLLDFSAHVTTWATTDRWNVKNVPTLLRAFSEHVARGSDRPSNGATRRGARVSADPPRRGARRVGGFDD